MGKIIAVCLQKGGVGKTTTAHTLANIFGKKGNRVLLVDCDDQCNSTDWTIDESSKRHTITEVISDLCPIEEAIIKAEYIDLLPADDYLANVNRDDDPDLTIFKQYIDPIKNTYDYIILDSPPSLSNVLNNILVCSDYVLIPTEARPDSMTGISRLMSTIENIQHSMNPSLKILGIVLIKFHERTILNKQIKAMIQGYSMGVKTHLFNTYIREGIAVPESRMMCEPLIDYAPKSKPAIDYMKLVDEIIIQIGE